MQCLFQFFPCLYCLRRMLEVTGGSMSTIYEDAGHDFPAMYAVSAVTCCAVRWGGAECCFRNCCIC